VTATFYSDNWILSHLEPMALANNVENIIFVTTKPFPEINKVKQVFPSAIQLKILGNVGARLFTFSMLALRNRPDYLIAFHLLINGIIAIILGKILGSPSVYICGGGPREVLGGGYTTENRIFKKIGEHSHVLEKILMRIANNATNIITMGNGAIRYFNDNGVTSPEYHVLPGGYNDTKFYASNIEKKYDLILVGRLSEVKRVDIFLRCIEELKKQGYDNTAVIIGDGPLLDELKKLAHKIGVGDLVTFAGWQDNVEHWLQLSKVFMLTSDSEGLSQAMIQGLMCGLPSIVSEVGDLGEVIQNGYNGYLVDDRNAAEFAKYVITILHETDTYELMKKNAIASVQPLVLGEAAKGWQSVFK